MKYEQMDDKVLKSSIYNRHFSHIYVEEEAKGYPITEELLNKLKGERRDDLKILEVDSYTRLFNRRRQNFVREKNSLSLILAVKHGNLSYKGAPFCQDFGNEDFYYTSVLLNCLFDCEYCYLSGMYPSAYVVLFVNIEDYFNDIADKLKDGRKAYYCISYDTDLLAFEGLFGLSRRFFEFASRPENKGLKIELRTKSAAVLDISGLSTENIENFVIAITLSPEKVIKSFEHRTPSLEARLLALKRFAAAGFPVRLIFDPVIKLQGFEEIYEEFFYRCETFLKENKIEPLDCGLGTFRISDTYLSNLRKVRKASEITSYPYESARGFSSYSEKNNERILKFCRERIERFIPSERIFTI